MISNLALLFHAILKAGMLCGILPGIALAVACECCGFRIVKVGFEKVRSEGRLSRFETRDGQLARLIPNRTLQRATSPSRKVRTA